ncbi:MAG: hypothetical protein KF816_13160 [Melioribacteraceae bacterium]|nr:hypothetical protein [Melioribacteraceae bacterium]
MVRIFKILVFFLLFGSLNLNAQNITISASTDTTHYKVGDFIRYQLEIKYNKSIRITPPPIKDSIKVLDFIEQLPSEKVEIDGKITEKLNFIFSKYDSAEVIIPSIKVFYKVGGDSATKYLESPEIKILVSTLPVDMQKDFADIKAPLTIPLPWWLILLIILIIVSLILGGYFIVKYYKRKKLLQSNILPQVEIPPHEIALTELNELKQKKLWQSGMVKEYHTEITGIVRKYFELRFNFNALEMTSAEIMGVISYLEDSKPITETADNFFRNADLVKFAKFEPLPEVNDEMMSQAFEIVNNTIKKRNTEVSGEISNV